MTTHVRSHFDRELAHLVEQILDLGSRARHGVAEGVQAFVHNDAELAREVISADATVNQLRYEIEQTCYEMLAMEQPVAGDLRAIVAALVISNEFERIGDHGKKLARLCLRFTGDPNIVPNDDIVRMSEVVLAMLDRILGAVAVRDVAEARAVCEIDDQVDAHYKQIFNVSLSYMLENPRAISPGTYHIQAAHELERVGDRVTNVAERLVYAVTGELIDMNI